MNIDPKDQGYFSDTASTPSIRKFLPGQITETVSNGLPINTPGAKIDPVEPSPLDIQIGGSHYKGLGIQPIEYMHANNIPFAEGCAIKYLTRWRDKGGIGDLKKARHFIDLLIDLESKKSVARLLQK